MYNHIKSINNAKILNFKFSHDRPCDNGSWGDGILYYILL